ncbi:hypothetical protein CYY_005618 [Polysphondylium violaceum]|uniref:Leucine-rich repeat-containing protein n=1 Tax=Polysphondylium violaceum TaxID=133409 RepID=A0A8J4UZH6_9MYCE|nr:hypothetical protein CYY_005618 [Polysphondylium violaceum]
MKLTPDILSSKLGKRVDIPNVEELSLPSMGFVDVSSFARLKSLKVLDLSGNRFQLVRHIKGLFDLPAISDLNLTGNPVTKQSLYRMTVIHYLPTLQVLDEKAIIDVERERARSFDPENASKDPLTKNTTDDDSEDEEEQDQNDKQDTQTKSADTTPTKKPQDTTESVPESKTKKLDEDSLFGPSKTKQIIFEQDEEISLDSVNLKDLEKKPVVKKPAAKISFLDDDEDDIFSSKSTKPIQAKPATTSNSSKFDLDDDLFGDSGSSKSSTLSSDFDISTYIQSQKNRSKGGLFD